MDVSAPAGTTGMLPGDTRVVAVNVQQSTWEVWTGLPSGTIEIRNVQTAPMANAGIAFSVVEGAGSVSPVTGTTDGNGNGSTTFTSGSVAALVLVEAAGASSTINFSEPVETWTWDHDEGLLIASLGTSGSTENVPSGEVQDVQVHVDYTSWSVWVSDWGSTEIRSYGTSPAIGAQILWSVVSGDGTVSPATSTTDIGGDAVTSFTMGSEQSVVQADVNYATSSTTYATVTFTPDTTERWTYDHTEASVSSISLGADGTTDLLMPGDQRTLTAAVTQDSYEVWTSNMGNTENRNYTTEAAAGVPVAFSLESGDGTLSAASVTTDQNGNAAVNFTMGAATSRVVADAGDGWTANIDLTMLDEIWTYDHSESALSSISLDADGPVDDIFPGETRTLTATVMKDTWEVWVSNLGGTENRNQATVPADGVGVAFSVESGDGEISAASATTDSDGFASVGFTMGAADSTVRADVEGGSASIALAHHEPVWQYVRTEYTISTSMSADDTTDALPPGTTRGVTAQVTFASWEIWEDDLGNTEIRNDASGAADGASVAFAVDPGDGTLSEVSATADSDGNATTTFTMGSEASTVRADVSYATATSSGSLDFTPDPWVFDHSEATVAMTLAADGATVTAEVSCVSWDVYRNGSDNENRNFASGPAIGTPVSFSGSEAVTLDSAEVTTDVDGRASTGHFCNPGTHGTISAEVTFLEITAHGRD